MKYFVYKITNKLNGKIYIGQSKDPIARFSHHCRSRLNKRKSRLQISMTKHGIENFELTILEEHDSKEAVKSAEIRLIAEYKTQDPDIGYNMTSGGDGCHDLSEESKEKMRAAHLGKKASSETRLKMSKSQRGRVMSPDHCKNLSIARLKTISEKGPQSLSEETKRLIGETSRGSKNPSAKLDENKVREIKKLLLEGNLKQHQIASMFNISRVTIGFIKNGRLWTHVKLEANDLE